MANRGDNENEQLKYVSLATTVNACEASNGSLQKHPPPIFDKGELRAIQRQLVIMILPFAGLSRNNKVSLGARALCVSDK